MSQLDQAMRTVLQRTAGLTLYARQWLDSSAAQDVVQEALTKLLLQSPLPDDPAAWMFRTVRNVAIDEARSISRRQKREQTIAEHRGQWFEMKTDSRLDAQTAEENLRTLPQELREIVVLRIWGEMGFTQIAQIMRMSVSTVHEKYSSALKQLRDALEKPCKTNLKRV